MKILAYEDSSLGLLILSQRELIGDPGAVVTEVTLNRQMLMSSYLTVAERALARLALERHPGRSLDVLVGGLGLGYTVHEVLRSGRAGAVEVVELLPQVARWLEEGLLPLSAELNADPRLVVTEGDVFMRLSGDPARTHDLVLIDVDHSPEERLGVSDGYFYSAEGLGRVKLHLSPGGILGVWSYSRNDAFREALARVFPHAWTEAVTFENALLKGEVTNWLYFSRAEGA